MNVNGTELIPEGATAEEVKKELGCLLTSKQSEYVARLLEHHMDEVFKRLQPLLQVALEPKKYDPMMILIKKVMLENLGALKEDLEIVTEE
jgi:hypothetical protein